MPSAWLGPQTNQCRQTRPFTGPWESCDSIRQEHALVDHAIGDIRDHRTSAPHRPFLLYLAFGACHFPHHVPRQFIEKYRGRYDIGWDAVRTTRLERQHRLGIVPAGTRLAPLNPGVTPWRDLAPDVRRLCARLQETYAAFLE